MMCSFPAAALVAHRDFIEASPVIPTAIKAMLIKDIDDMRWDHTSNDLCTCWERARSVSQEVA